MRFDQYKVFSDSQDHKDKLLAEAVAVKQAATERQLELSIKTTNVGPQPSWCEEILATVSQTDTSCSTRPYQHHLAYGCLHVQISVGEERNVGRILAYQVSRSSLRWSSKPFHHFLDIPSHENCNVANALFDRHGQLKRHLYGNFGAETNQGELLYIRDIQMKPQFRKQGLATLALKYLLRRLSQRQEEYEQPTEWWLAGQQQLPCPCPALPCPALPCPALPCPALPNNSCAGLSQCFVALS